MRNIITIKLLQDAESRLISIHQSETDVLQKIKTEGMKDSNLSEIVERTKELGMLEYTIFSLQKLIKTHIDNVETKKTVWVFEEREKNIKE